MPTGAQAITRTEVLGDAKRIAGGRQPLVAHQDIDRIGRQVVLGEVGHGAVGAGRERRRDGGMRQAGRNQGFELGDEPVHSLRRQVELEHLDGHQTTAIGIVCTKDRAQRSRADLM